MPSSPPPSSISAGAVKLAALGKKHTFAEIARRIGKTEATVRHHSTGRRVPDASVQKAYASAYGVSTELWTRTAKAGDSKKAPPRLTRETVAKVVARDTTALEEIRATLTEIDAAIAAAKTDESTSPGHLAQLFNAKTNAARMLARLTGTLDVSEAMLAASSAWQRLSHEIIQALEAYPDAAKAVLSVIARLDDVSPQPAN